MSAKRKPYIPHNAQSSHHIRRFPSAVYVDAIDYLHILECADCDRKITAGLTHFVSTNRSNKDCDVIIRCILCYSKTSNPTRSIESPSNAPNGTRWSMEQEDDLDAEFLRQIKKNETRHEVF